MHWWIIVFHFCFLKGAITIIFVKVWRLKTKNLCKIREWPSISSSQVAKVSSSNALQCSVSSVQCTLVRPAQTRPWGDPTGRATRVWSGPLYLRAYFLVERELLQLRGCVTLSMIEHTRRFVTTGAVTEWVVTYSANTKNYSLFYVLKIVRPRGEFVFES